MNDVGISFAVLEDDTISPVVWKKTKGHIVFDVKNYFASESQCLLYGQNIPDLLGSKYSGVVSRNSVRIYFVCDVLNGIDVCDAEIMNYYLQSSFL